MNLAQAFLAQARSDEEVFWLLHHLFSASVSDDAEAAALVDRYFRADEVPECHPLHYLQMAAEKLSKAAYLATGGAPPAKWYHDVQYFRNVWAVLRGTSVVAEALAVSVEDMDALFDRVEPVRDAVFSLQPTGTRRNVEYPWEERPGDWRAPALEPFGQLGATDLAVYEFSL